MAVVCLTTCGEIFGAARLGPRGDGGAGRSVVTSNQPHRARAACPWHSERHVRSALTQTPETTLSTPERVSAHSEWSAPCAPSHQLQEGAVIKNRPDPASVS